MSSNEQKRICYLMAVYNDPQGMLRTLSSLFDDAPLADILIVDDGSAIPLTLPAMPSGFSATLLRLEHNGGIACALNEGLRHILTRPYDYVARIDAGDRVMKGRLFAQSVYLETHPSVGVLGTQMDAINPISGRTLFRIANPGNPKNSLYRRNALAHPSAMIRAEALRQCGLYDPRYLYAEDYELWRRIGLQYDLANLPQAYVQKEIIPTQITARKRTQTRLARLRVQCAYLDYRSLRCWMGIARSLISFCVPGDLWLALRGTYHKAVCNPVSEAAR